MTNPTELPSLIFGLQSMHDLMSDGFISCEPSRALLREAIDRLRASYASAPEWQPIETAPKTGRTLLLGYFNALSKWRTLRGQWFTDAVIQEEWTNSDVHEAGWFETSVECDDEDNGCWPTDPTHWQPLPTPPATLGETK